MNRISDAKVCMQCYGFMNQQQDSKNVNQAMFKQSSCQEDQSKSSSSINITYYYLEQRYCIYFSFQSALSPFPLALFAYFNSNTFSIKVLSTAVKELTRSLVVLLGGGECLIELRFLKGNSFYSCYEIKYPNFIYWIYCLYI